jgi:hypothetical protein
MPITARAALAPPIYTDRYSPVDRVTTTGFLSCIPHEIRCPAQDLHVWEVEETELASL